MPAFLLNLKGTTSLIDVTSCNITCSLVEFYRSLKSHLSFTVVSTRIRYRNILCEFVIWEMTQSDFCCRSVVCPATDPRACPWRSWPALAQTAWAAAHTLASPHTVAAVVVVVAVATTAAAVVVVAAATVAAAAEGDGEQRTIPKITSARCVNNLDCANKCGHSHHQYYEMRSYL